MRKSLCAAWISVIVLAIVALAVVCGRKDEDYGKAKTQKNPEVIMRLSVGTTFSGNLTDWIPYREGVLRSDESLEVTIFDVHNQDNVISIERVGFQKGLISDINADMRRNHEWFQNSELMIRDHKGIATLYVYESDTKMRYPSGLNRLLTAVNRAGGE